MITNIIGNVFDSNAQIIGHCVNCQGKMGAGIAIQVRRKFPKVFEEYKDYCNQSWENILGTCLLVPTSYSRKKYIANLFGQVEPKTNEKALDDIAFAQSMVALSAQMSKLDLKTLALPKFIGCGLAGGDWKVVLTLITKILDKPSRMIEIIELPQD